MSDPNQTLLQSPTPPNENLRPCPACGRMLSWDCRCCPGCGKNIPSLGMTYLLIGILAAIIMLGIGAGFALH